jgi:site-specific DNA-methyltransferase (adenine-specific)
MGAIQAKSQIDELALLEQWSRSLAECREFDEIKTIRNKGEALRAYFRKFDDSQRSMNIAAAIKVRCERRIGQLLAEMAEKGQRKGRGRPNAKTSDDLTFSRTLSDLGFNRQDAHHCMAIAAVPDVEFERIVTLAVRDNRELTSRELYVLGRRHQRLRQKRDRLEEGGAATGGEPGGIGADPASEWQIHRADCLEFLPTIPEGSVRLAFADPPYNIGMDYGDHYDDNLERDEFCDWCGRWLCALDRVVADDGSFWLLINHQWAQDLRALAEGAGFHLRQWLTWYESFGVNTTRMFNLCSRPLLWFVKDPDHFVFNEQAPQIRRKSAREEKYNDGRANPEGKLWDDVWGINPEIPRVPGTARERMPDFPTQLPLALLRPIVACASEPGDLVLDPFSGSGTTGAACIELGRRFLGIELSEEFADLSRLRLLSHLQESRNGQA